VVLSQGAPLRSRVERRLPALSSVRGHSPAQEIEMSGGGEAAHVGADFRNDDLSGEVTDPGDGPQLADRLAERVEPAVHLRVDLANGGLERLNLAQVQTQQKAVMGCNASLQSGVDPLRRCFDTALEQRQQHVRVGLAVDQGLQDGAA
jgi:hypothetical protein